MFDAKPSQPDVEIGLWDDEVEESLSLLAGFKGRIGNRRQNAATIGTKGCA